MTIEMQIENLQRFANEDKADAAKETDDFMKRYYEGRAYAFEKTAEWLEKHVLPNYTPQVKD